MPEIKTITINLGQLALEVKKISPIKGDIVLLTYDASQIHPVEMEQLQERIIKLAQWQDRDFVFVIAPQELELNLLDEARMFAHGWIKASRLPAGLVEAVAAENAVAKKVLWMV